MLGLSLQSNIENPKSKMRILLSTLNARYQHASFGLRYLLANMGDLLPQTQILEFDINQRVIDIAELILQQNPRILGLGVYIWNVAQTTELVALLKRIAPDLTIILGGPEVSYECEQQEIVRLADFTITGEADLAFADLCRRLLAGRRPLNKIIPADLPEFDQLQLPYDYYSDEDIAHRILYVEASRGCPFECEFCLSSLDVPVRNAPLDVFLAAMQKLIDRGARQVKFVDRTFNLNAKIGRAILEFFLKQHEKGQGGFTHFEMIPDRLPLALREPISEFPPGALQFEVGVQTFNEEVSQLISRKQDNGKLAENFRFLREQTGVHVHADLIVGLPGEDVASFAAGFDKLVALRPQEIQVGILKRLRGTPITRHDQEWQMVYSPHPPYEILHTRLIDFPTMQRLRRFARYWDLVSNSGNFTTTAPLLWSRRPSHQTDPSPFARFLEFSDWLHIRAGRRTHGIALHALSQMLQEYLIEIRKLDATEVTETLAADAKRAARQKQTSAAPTKPIPRRQARHLKKEPA